MGFFSRFSLSSKRNTVSLRRGSNTAEYVVLLVLVVVGSIGAFTLFGNTIKSQIKRVTASITGNDSEYKAAAGEVSGYGTALKGVKASNMAGPASEEVFAKGAPGSAAP